MYADATPIAADKSRERLDEITGCVIGAGQRVSSVLGYGFLEKVVEQSVIVEIKATEQLGTIDRAQCVHYLRATGLRVCLLMNFGRPRLEFRRFVANF